MREEGDWTGSDALMTEARPVVPGGHNLATGYSDVVQRSYFTGDWPRLVGAAEAAIASPGGEGDIQARGLCAWIRMLRAEPRGRADPAPASEPSDRASEPSDEVDDLLAAGRRSGFHRLQWVALGHGALCRALQGRVAEAEALLVELAKAWRDVRAIASGEWIDAAAHAASLSGRAAAV